MTMTTTPHAGPRTARPGSEVFRRALAAEVVRVRSVRSLAWSFPVYVVLVIALSVVYGVVGRERDLPRFDPVGLGLSTAALGVLVLVVVGVLVVTTEFSSGTLAAGLLAVPDRTRFYAAKLAVLAAGSAVAAVLGVVPGFVAVQVVLGDRAAPADVATVLHVAGAVVYTVLLVVFSAGVATVLRSSAATLSTLLPLFFMVSTILDNIPAVSSVAQFLPDVAGARVLQADGGDAGVLNPATGLLVLLGWTVLAVAAGHAALRRRDA